MAKIYGLFGSMTGKLADTVMVVRNGEQLARKYQPVVYNPSTAAQIGQRAKMKLMSQLSSVMAPYIAMRREGPISTRNRFVKENFRNTTYANNKASIDLANVVLTKSVVALPPIVATQGTGVTNVSLGGSGLEQIDVDRVIYVGFVKQADDTLRFLGSTVVNEAGPGWNWPGTLPLTTAVEVIYAYGVRDNNENARAIFGNLRVPSAEDVAQILVTSSLAETDVTLTETRCVIWTPGE